MNKKRTINIPFRYLALAAYLYIITPILIFFVTWLRWTVGVPMAAVLALGFIVLFRTDYLKNKNELSLPVGTLVLIAFAFLLWVWLSGQGGFFYQTWDHHGRNAVFRDLIQYRWPVIYPETGNALVYYLLHWIVPALFGKAFGWLAGNIALALWTYLGVMISFLLIVYLCRGYQRRQLWIVCAVFIAWSGLNVLGMLVSQSLQICTSGFLFDEGWLDFTRNGFDCSYLYRSNFDALSQVFNQAVVPWITVPLLLENRKVRNFAFIGLYVLPYAPIPFIGFLPFFFVMAFPWYRGELHRRNYRGILTETFSIPNCTAAVTIFVTFFFYFRCNLAGGTIGLFVPPEAFDIPRVLTLLLFYFIEFGAVAFLIYPNYKRDALFYTVLISLIVIPLFRIGNGRDFCMNASFAALFTLMIFTAQALLDHPRPWLRLFALVAALTLAAATPAANIARRTANMIIDRSFPVVADRVKTFGDKNIGDECPDTDLENFLVPDPETKLFYQYFAKK